MYVTVTPRHSASHPRCAPLPRVARGGESGVEGEAEPVELVVDRERAAAQPAERDGGGAVSRDEEGSKRASE